MRGPAFARSRRSTERSSQAMDTEVTGPSTASYTGEATGTRPVFERIAPKMMAIIDAPSFPRAGNR